MPTKLVDFKKLFEPHIIERGQKYFKEGRVTRLRNESNRWIAKVQGSGRYQVAIELSKNGWGDVVIDDMSCTCEYWDNCKHQVAVLLTLQQDINVTDTPKVSEPNFIEQIEQFSVSELCQFLLFAFDKQPSLQQDWVFWTSQFYPKSDNDNQGKDGRKLPSEQAVLKTIYQRIRTILPVDEFDEYDYYAEYAFDWSPHAHAFSDLLEQFSHQPTLQIEASLYWVSQIVDNFAEFLDKPDCDELYAPALAYLGKLLFNHELSGSDSYSPSFNDDLVVDKLYIDGDMIAHVAVFFESWQQYESQYDERFKRLWLDFLLAQGKFDTAKTWLDTQIAKVRKNEYDDSRLTSLANLKIALLYHLGEYQLANSTQMDFAFLPKIRQAMVDDYLARQHINQAIHLIQEGIAIADKDSPTATTWEKQLIAIAQQHHRTDIDRQSLVRKHSFAEAFRYTAIDKEAYQRWKDTFTADDWQIAKSQQQAKLLNEIKPQNYMGIERFSGSSQLLQLANFFALEKENTALVNLIKEHPADKLLMQYSQILAQTHQDWLIDILAKKWQYRIRFLDGRKEYNELARHISQSVAKFPAGKATWQLLVAEWQTEYKKKRALVDELNKIRW